MEEKVLEYLEAGSELVWVIDPASRSVTAWRPPADAHVYREDEILEAGQSLEGFSLLVAEILA